MTTDRIAVLDKGFVRLLETMGDDSSIVQAARISYGKGTKTVREDRGLIRYLMRHGHTTPFEMCEAKFHLRIPMDAWRQMVRHRTASINEYSTRYSEAIDDKQQTRHDAWRLQTVANKQGSDGFLPKSMGETLSFAEAHLHDMATALYKQRLAQGVAREQARKDLPLSTYTEVYWKMDLHNLFHFLKLRLDPHAQLEIRSYARAIATFVERWVPIAWEAFNDYRLSSLTFTGPEVEVLRSALGGGYGADRLSVREWGEFEKKLQRLGDFHADDRQKLLTAVVDRFTNRKQPLAATDCRAASCGDASSS